MPVSRRCLFSLWIFALSTCAAVGCIFDRSGIGPASSEDAAVSDGAQRDSTASSDSSQSDRPPVATDGDLDGTVTLPPVSPTDLIAVPVSTSRIDLTWTDNSDNEDVFEIERSTDGGGSFTPLGTVGANVTASNDTGLSPQTQYCYRVRAANAAGASGYSNVACATTDPITWVEQWTAYNDLGWWTGQLETNITKFTSPNTFDDPVQRGLTNTGELVDYSTGGGTSAILTIGGGLYDPIRASHEQYGRNHAPGTDAGDVFSSIVTMDGLISYEENPLGTPTTNPLVLTFTGLDPTARYELVFLSDREAYPNFERACLATISSADSFLNASSTGTDNNSNPLFSGPGDPSTRLPSDNTNGWVARFVDIEPGVDGEIVLTITHDGATSGGSLNKGKYANAVMLREFAPQ